MPVGSIEALAEAVILDFVVHRAKDVAVGTGVSGEVARLVCGRSSNGAVVVRIKGQICLGIGNIGYSGVEDVCFVSNQVAHVGKSEAEGCGNSEKQGRLHDDRLFGSVCC